MKEKPKTAKQAVKRTPLRVALAFKLKNYLLMGAGIAAIAIGFLCLNQGSTTLAPILLVLGFCVLIPVGILIK
jgi:hypothetical protein